MGRGDLTDEQWARLEPSMPVGKKPGRPPAWSKGQLVLSTEVVEQAGVTWLSPPMASASEQVSGGGPLGTIDRDAPADV
ncbi:hypothetical protein O1Q96_22975 [Streptomyces sp. Qhu-G9]|uniref:hypothetical protein n=1 Tax=Streptomyces sp. Qhu-G9 TaxID=3452799 RepID=UPI0022AC14BF|nr:hypothetical protein [Streptomyces aurantiacus]WAU82370.1 hypothetical protein O1Q96_22975 [Streptomyces aurantiacus]